jgi:hypothetical protein
MKKYQKVACELMVVERAAWWNPRLRRMVNAAPLVVMFLLLNTRAARAACSFNPTPDPTVDGSANSLRQAVIMANASGEDCLIQLEAGTYTLTIKNTNGQENAAAQGDLDITDSGHTVTIQGQGPTVSIVNANGIDRVFQVLDGANAAFSKMTITGGVAVDDGTAGASPRGSNAEGGGVLVQDGAHVTLSQVWLDANRAVATHYLAPSCAGPTAAGGGLYLAAPTGLFLSTGMVDLTDSIVSGNTLRGGSGIPSGAAQGGGLFIAAGELTLNQTTVSRNSANGGPPFFASGNGGDAEGGGLFIGGGELKLSQTTVSSNSANAGSGAEGGMVYSGGAGGSAQGAAIFVAGGDISLANSTLFANIAKGGGGSGAGTCTGGCYGGSLGAAAGGGLYLSSGSISLTGDTLAANEALGGVPFSFRGHGAGPSSGGGIANAGAALVTNTTLIGNNTQDSGEASNGDDVSGPITSSYCLMGQRAGATITDDGGNVFNVDPELDPKGLRYNGGVTQTVALEDGSPAIDGGDNAICKASPPTGLGGIDQRGYPRFYPGDELCDIGAFEYTDLLVRPDSICFGTQPLGQQSKSQSVYVTNNQPITVALSKIMSGTDAADFSESGTCGTSLAPDTSCTISVAFKPGAAGDRTALLTVSDSPDRTSPYKVPLDGTGK